MRWKKIAEAAAEALDDVLAYILTVVGILASSYLPLLAGTGKIEVVVDYWRLGLSAVVALLIVGKQEQLDAPPDNRVAARAGRKKRFGHRMSNALAQGMMWAQVMGIVTKQGGM
jgi:hypothetical protein